MRRLNRIQTVLAMKVFDRKVYALRHMGSGSCGTTWFCGHQGVVGVPGAGLGEPDDDFRV